MILISQKLKIVDLQSLKNLRKEQTIFVEFGSIDGREAQYIYTNARNFVSMIYIYAYTT